MINSPSTRLRIALFGLIWITSVGTAFIVGQIASSRDSYDDVPIAPATAHQESSDENLAETELPVPAESITVEEPPTPARRLMSQVLSLISRSPNTVLRAESDMSDDELVQSIVTLMEGIQPEIGFKSPFTSAFYESADLRIADAFLFMAELSRREDKGISAMARVFDSAPPDPETATKEEIQTWNAQFEFAKDYLAALDDLDAFRILLDNRSVITDDRDVNLG